MPATSPLPPQRAAGPLSAFPRSGRAAVLISLLGLALLQVCTAASSPGTNRLLVIAPAAFHPALRAFVAHKQKLLPTELCSLEDILEHNSGFDEPEKLKRFLYDQWRHHHLRYALLVGDVDVMPVRFMVLDRVTPAADNYAFYPTDLYYSDLAKPDGSFDDWNARKDGFHRAYFGEVRGEANKHDPINYDEVDYRPEIAVGRWPVSTPDEVKVVADKTVAYENALLAGTSPSLRRAAFVAVGGWVDSRDLLDRLADELRNTWHVEKCYYSDTRLHFATPDPDRQQVRALLNQGLGLVVHTGHGQEFAWYKCFTVRDLDLLTNATHLPVIISAGCSTAHFAPLPPYEAYVDVDGKEHAGTDEKEVFDRPPPPPSPYQRGRYNTSGLGEQLLKHSANGAVAYIGCDTGSQPCALTLVEGFITALAQARTPRLGDCWTSAIRFYYDHEHLADLKPTAGWYPPSIFFQGMKFMLFGDPSLPLPTRQELSAEASPHP